MSGSVRFGGGRADMVMAALSSSLYSLQAFADAFSVSWSWTESWFIMSSVGVAELEMVVLSGGGGGGGGDRCGGGGGDG